MSTDAKSRSLRVLIVEDCEEDAILMLDELRRAGVELTHERVQNEEGVRRAANESWDVVLSDYSLPDFDGMRALRILRAHDASLPFIVVTGSLDEESAAACLREGADDYILKGNMTRLAPAVHRAIERHDEKRKRRALEDELRRVQRLDSLGRLAGGVAHDFNNLLTVIQGYAEVLGDALDASDPAADQVTRMQNAAQVILETADRGAQLTRQLLSFGQKRPLKPEVCSPGERIASLRRMLEGVIGRDITVDEQCDPDAGCVIADPTQLEQVYLNLIVNARDAMPSGGTLTISTGKRTVAEGDVAAGEYVVTRISDTGVGMSDEVLARLFEPFFTTKGPGSGTGLGLATVYGIVRQLGGAVHVRSRVGAGSTFEVLLPRVECAPTAAKGAETETPKELDRSGRVLVVEDDKAIRELVCAFLTDAGMQAVPAEDGEAALREIDRDPNVDLVLCDVVMPGISGPELVRRLREAEPDLAVIFTSGYAQRDAERVTRLPDDARLLQKPFTKRALLDEVARAYGV